MQQDIQYDPLKGVPQGSAEPSPIPGREQEKGEHEFEGFTLFHKLIGIFALLPLYLFIIPYYILPIPVSLILDKMNITDATEANAIVNLVYQVLMILLILAFYRKFFACSFRDLKRRSLAKNLKHLLFSQLLFLGMTFLFSIIETVLIGNSVSQNQESVYELATSMPMITLLLSTLLAPFVEETLFRGVIFRTARPLGAILACVISAISFGFIHVMETVITGDFHELIYIITYFGMGLGLAIIYEKYKNILFPIAVHMIHNGFATVLILLLAKSGILEGTHFLYPLFPI